MLDSTSPISSLSGIIKRSESMFKKLGLVSIRDLLFHVPIGYDDRREVSTIENLHEGMQATIKGRISLMENKRSFRHKQMICEMIVEDATGNIRVVWFGNRFIHKTLRVGDELYLNGKVHNDQWGLQFRSPEYEKVKDISLNAATIVPRYSLTHGLTHKMMRFCIAKALDECVIPEWLPYDTLSRRGLMKIHDALRMIHFPREFKEVRVAEKRLKFDELFLVQMRSRATQIDLRGQIACAIPVAKEALASFVISLPFSLTNDQRKVAWQILLDTQKQYPMNRLLQGDVGSGKTLVAAIAMYNVALYKQVSVLMVPTEILAAQHYATFVGWFKKLGIGIGVYTRGMRHINGDEVKLSKKEFDRELSVSNLSILIGTHALLSDKLVIDNLGLVIVDEQHRFGVRQRRAIKEHTKGEITPHFLSMTATPIPRSAALTLYGELEMSRIQEKPVGRKSISTKIILENERTKVYDLICNQVDRQRQVFVVCPMIDETEGIDIANVQTVYDTLRTGPFARYRLAMIHGKMKSGEKDEIMKKWRMD